MVVRKAHPEDLPVIVDFQQKMAEETENISLNEGVLKNGVERIFTDPSKGFYLLVEEEGSIIACMMLTPEWSDWRNRLFLWIQSLYVLPEYRQQGIFRKMYKHVKMLVNNSEEYAGLKLYVARENKVAQEVYYKIGMQSSHYQLFEWNKMDF